AKPSDETVMFVKDEGHDAPYEKRKAVLTEVARLLSTAPLAAPERVEALLAEVETLKEQLARREAAGPLDADTLLKEAATVGNTTVVVAEAPDVALNQLRQLIDQIRQKADSVAVLLATVE